MTDLLIKNGTIIDGTGREPYEAAVLVRGDRIEAVGQVGELQSTAEGAEVIDAEGHFVLPGLINSHEHLCLKGALADRSSDVLSYYDIYRQDPNVQLLRGVRGALLSLQSGVTTVRDAGAMSQLTFHLVEGVEKGIIEGPRIYTCGSPLSIPYTGEEVKPAGMTVDAGGPEEVREVVRDLVERGADFIKVKGHRRDFSSPDRTALYSPQEIEAAVSEGHSLGVPVTIHAWHTEIIASAIESHAEGIEHGNPLSDRPELAEQMAAQGMFIVPNVMSWSATREASADRNKKTGIETEKIWDSTELAIRAGVRVGIGTDLYGGSMSREMTAMLECGMSPMDAIMAATRIGAEILGLSDRLGTLEVGKLADIIVVASSPLEMLKVLDDPVLVIKGGRTYHPAALVDSIGPSAAPSAA